jgi:uncharacterized protein (DUF433 family)
MTAIQVLRTEHSWIQKSPDVCGGNACIRNTRVPVWSLVVARRHGVDDGGMLNHFVTPLSSADVDVAFAYYNQHAEEIEQEIGLNQEA